MRGRMVVWMVAVAALALVSTARAAHDGMLDADALKQHAKKNKALARYLKYNGYPELAEVRTIRDQVPWDDHEVTLYYLGSRKEISFARARVLGRPEVHVARYERVLTDADIRSLKARGSVAATAGSKETVVASACTGNATKRAECSASRAEAAADRVEAAAGRTETAAARTEAVVDKMVAARSKKSAGKPRAAAKRRAAAKPEVAAKPEAAANPEATAKPEAAANPEAAAKPEAAANPEAAAKPEAAANPEAAAKPEAASDRPS